MIQFIKMISIYFYKFIASWLLHLNSAHRGVSKAVIQYIQFEVFSLTKWHKPPLGKLHQLYQHVAKLIIHLKVHRTVMSPLNQLFFNRHLLTKNPYGLVLADMGTWWTTHLWRPRCSGWRSPSGPCYRCAVIRMLLSQPSLLHGQARQWERWSCECQQSRGRVSLCAPQKSADERSKKENFPELLRCMFRLEDFILFNCHYD